jgi:hypothetical protein
MALLDNVKELLTRYAGESAPQGDAGAHFQQVAQSVDSGTLASGIAAAMRSDETPPFSHMVSQLFASGSNEQKSGMLNTLLSSLSPDQRAQIATSIPGLGTASLEPGTTPTSGISADTVQQLAQQVEQRNASIVDKMSAFYAQHPTLVKTLGSGAMMIAMRKIAERQR